MVFMAGSPKPAEAPKEEEEEEEDTGTMDELNEDSEQD